MNTKIFALALAQCCYWFATLVGISLSAIVGSELSQHSELATLPFALASLGGLASTYALSLFMQYSSRRAGLRLGAVSGVLAAGLSCLALQMQSFWTFCFASLIMGCYQASSVYYRLAAMEVAHCKQQNTAVSWVLCGSLIAAIIGPSLATVANSWSLGANYTGPYVLVAGFAVLAYVSLGWLQTAPLATTKAPPKQEFATAYSVQFRIGVLNTAVAQFLMMLMMVIAPLAMHAQGYAVSVSLSVIGWHIIGMFLPSFFSGRLIDRYGEQTLIVIGYGIFMSSALVALLGQKPMHYFCSLFLLGCAWNLVYIAGTAQYNKGLRSENKGKTQGIAELFIAFAGAIAVFSGGVMVSLSSWAQINQLALVLVLLASVLNLGIWCNWLRQKAA